MSDSPSVIEHSDFSITSHILGVSSHILGENDLELRLLIVLLNATVKYVIVEQMLISRPPKLSAPQLHVSSAPGETVEGSQARQRATLTRHLRLSST